MSAADMRSLLITLSLAGALAPVRGTTLERLPLREMTQKSTAIVRAKVVGATGVLRGADVYTVYQIEIFESWKGNGKSPVQVAVPGGVAGGLRQMVAGAPSLHIGEEYVMFLWTSRSGLTQVMGLSQGLFNVRHSDSEAGGGAATRAAAGELMLDSSGHAVKDEAVSMKLSDLKAQVRALSGEE